MGAFTFSLVPALSLLYFIQKEGRENDYDTADPLSPDGSALGKAGLLSQRRENDHRCFWLWSYCNGYGFGNLGGQVRDAEERVCLGMSRGYKAPKQGTYYGYFAPAAKRYGLKAYMLNGTTIYGKQDSPYHAKAKAALDQGHLVIACMGPGLWTSSGHFVLLWKLQGNTVFLNDPASTRLARTQGNYALFRKQVKYYFVVERPTKK